MSNALSHLAGGQLAGLLIGDDQTSPAGNGWQTIRARVLAQEVERKRQAQQRAMVDGWRQMGVRDDFSQ